MSNWFQMPRAKRHMVSSSFRLLKLLKFLIVVWCVLRWQVLGYSALQTSLMSLATSSEGKNMLQKTCQLHHLFLRQTLSLSQPEKTVNILHLKFFNRINTPYTSTTCWCHWTAHTGTRWSCITWSAAAMCQIHQVSSDSGSRLKSKLLPVPPGPSLRLS